ncbi:MAG: hypothetical protein IPM12_03640 [Flavobacteriales bacterium]|nr:hypothetical protein [Flavobacteriales bacterium]
MLRCRSLLTALSLCAVLFALRWVQPPTQTLTWDVFGYYLYLPAIVIHDDPALKNHAWLDEVMATYDPSTTLYQLVDGPNDARVIKYSSGMALAYAPWFFIAHLLAGPLGFPADGFSPTYSVAVTFGVLLWVMLGLFLFRRVLRHFFSDGWTAVLLVLVVVGTNFLHLVALDGTLLTHPFLFTLYAGLLLATIHWHKKPTWQAAIAMGATAGWITLVRPNEGVCVLLPLLWANSDGFSAKWRLVRAHVRHVVLAAIAFLVMASPQLVYWRSVTGQWLFYSYINPGEGFDFASPYTWDYLFSLRKGWFVYTPLAMLMLGGLLVLWQRARNLFLPIAVFCAINLYITSSWTCWWYAGGSFSARSMMPMYVLLALPLGFLLKEVVSGGWRRPAFALLGFIVALNLFQTWQWSANIISKDRMTGAYYAAIFGRTSIPSNAEELLLVQRSISGDERLEGESRYQRHLLYRNTFDEQPDSVFTLSTEQPFSSGPDIRYRELTNKDHAWLRISARLWVTDSSTTAPLIVCAFHHNGPSYKYVTRSWDRGSVQRNAWNQLSFDYLTPEVRSKDDNLKVYFWNQAGGTHRVDDLQVEVFHPR